MKAVIHKSETRGNANHGWLNTNHSFSFANYYDPERMNFGALRVLNDDTIAADKGFGMHPHNNMEIITIPLEGDLAHKDSMENSSVIKEGDVQVMSAGSGIYHSEFNQNEDKEVKLLQIWVFPNKENVEPRYDQITLNMTDFKDQFGQILSPNKEDQGVWIHQNAWFHLGDLTEGLNLTYNLKDPSNGVYVFLIEGEVKIENNLLKKRDGLGIWEVDKIGIQTQSDSKVLLMEVPMNY